MTVIDADSVSNISGSTLTEIAAAIRSGETSSVEVVEKSIAVARKYDEAVGLYITRFDDSALEAAANADAVMAAGDPVGPLHGVPLGIKDIISTVEAPTTGQSVVHDQTVLSGDAVVVDRLRRAGGIMMGKLTTMEFACGEPDPSKPFPVPRTSWSLDHWAGGSSSGSGSAVSLGAAFGTLGTDTGGSIRIPAAYSGITGLMPTYGRVPKSGTIPLGYSLDHIGPMARSARDCAVMLEVMAGAHPSDPTSVDIVPEQFTSAFTDHLDGVRIGVDRLKGQSLEYDPAVDTALDSALEVLAGLGAEIVDVSLPHYADMQTVDEVIMYSEAFSYHLPDFRSRWSDFGLATRQAIGTGFFYSAADYMQAQRARRVGQKAVKALFETVDLVLTPTAGGGAAPLKRMEAGHFQQGGFGPIFTGYWDTVGNPVVGVPCGFTQDNLPLGMQIAGRWFDESLVLRAADAFQQQTKWHTRVPDPLARRTEIVTG